MNEYWAKFLNLRNSIFYCTTLAMHLEYEAEIKTEEYKLLLQNCLKRVVKVRE